MAVEGTLVIDAQRVLVTASILKKAFVDVVASDAVAFVTMVTMALERAHRIGAAGVLVARTGRIAVIAAICRSSITSTAFVNI